MTTHSGGRPGADDRRALGAEKERLAERFLAARGLRLVARNHRCRYGEIDLVMRDAGILVFVEVRFRRSSRFGTPVETVDRHKQRRLIAAAQHYLSVHPCALPCRFDVLGIGGRDEIQWVRDAFVVDVQ